jgi:hypothetical protein
MIFDIQLWEMNIDSSEESDFPSAGTRTNTFEYTQSEKKKEITCIRHPLAQPKSLATTVGL